MYRSRLGKYTRRQFLHTSATAALVGSSGMLSGCASNQYAESGIGRVVVIGAGIAGISAANALQRAGYGVVVLEGSNRVGGRIHTDRSLGVPIELGAARIRGMKKNPITPYAELAKIEYRPFEWSNLSGASSDGVEIDRDRLSKARSSLFRMVARAVIRNLGRKKDATVAEIIQHERDLKNLTQEEEHILNFSLASAEIASGSPFAQASWKNLRDYEAYSGPEQMVINGFDALPKLLSEFLDVRFKTTVKAIDYSGDEIRVVTDNTTFTADYVVVTVSLGVLQAKGIEFVPELPEHKQRAIGRMGMGNVNKIGLRFPEIFWPIDSHALVHGSDTIGEFSSFINIARYTWEPVLLAMIPESYRDALEGVPDETVVREAYAVLQGMYGSRIPAPTQVVRSEWKADPLFRGATSYNKIGALSEDRDDLAQSVDRKLFFAGEATHRKKYGSVGGAYVTGQRAMRDILQATTLPKMT
ncbi:MAG: NAD(P)/FAD-dependent oxidoreductase [Candidatus Hydrogenedentota bacterium]